ncbi:MAG: penicillin acylase family protein [Chthonomonadales bacterium]
MRHRIRVAFGLWICLGAAINGPLQAEPSRGHRAVIYRDGFGVPSIQANRLEDAVYALGYVTGTDCPERMCLNYKQARGRMAEVQGRQALLGDTFIRSLGMEEAAQAQVRRLAPYQRQLINAFCQGANRAIAERKSQLPAWIQPVTPADVLALAQFVNSAFPLLSIAQSLLPGFGSNQFAIAARRTADGHAIVSMDPHLTWDGPLVWYEFAFYSPGLNFRGVTIPGLPFGVMGHTDRVAWCMTNNDPSLFALYQVRVNPANPHQYNAYGKWRNFEEVPIELRYREGSTLRTVRQMVRKTIWGPLAPFTSTAVDLTTVGHWGMLDEALDMARAHDARDFRKALKKLGISMWNIVYADIHGTIGYQYNARVPRRDASFDWRKSVPGEDPRTRLGAPWPLDDLPHVENPASGLLVNCNSAPWLTPLGDELRAGSWPAYVTSSGRTTRYDRLAALLKGLDHTVTPQKAMTIATDTLVPYARETAAALEAAFGRFGADGNPDLAGGISILRGWNGRADIASEGCGLYFYWLNSGTDVVALSQKAGRGEDWSADESREALRALGQAVRRMKADHGRLDVPWGEMHYSLRDGHRAPVSGFQYGPIVAVVPNTGPFRNGNIECNVGSSFRMIVDLDPKGVRSWAILPYGEVQDPKSPHFADQQVLFGRGGYKDTLFGLERIRRGAASTMQLVWGAH